MFTVIVYASDLLFQALFFASFQASSLGNNYFAQICDFTIITNETFEHDSQLIFITHAIVLNAKCTSFLCSVALQ